MKPKVIEQSPRVRDYRQRSYGEDSVRRIRSPCLVGGHSGFPHIAISFPQSNGIQLPALFLGHRTCQSDSNRAIVISPVDSYPHSSCKEPAAKRYALTLCEETCADLKLGKDLRRHVGAGWGSAEDTGTVIHDS